MKRNRVVIFLAGRMGNQLFQMAAAEYVRDIYGRDQTEVIILLGSETEKYLSLENYKTIKLNNFHTKIANFLLSRSLAIGSTWRANTLKSCRYYFGFLMRLILRSRKINLHISEDLIALPAMTNIGSSDNVLIGYFQGYSPDTDSIEAKRTLLKLVEHDMDKKYESLLSPQTIVLHLRMTDYWDNPDLGVLGLDYYLRALEDLNEKGVDLSDLLIITDETNLQLSKLPIPLIDARILSPSELDANGAFHLLRNASTAVISNSSFAWWGAFLSATTTTADRRVLYPTPWFRNVRGVSSFPQDWIPIQASWAERIP